MTCPNCRHRIRVLEDEEEQTGGGVVGHAGRAGTSAHVGAQRL